MDVRVLGTMEVLDPGPVPIGGPAQHRALGMLVVDAGGVVSVDRLVEGVWPNGDTPAQAERTIRKYVHRLRNSLGDAGERIETVGSGYRLRLERPELDVFRFEDLVDEARGAADRGESARADGLLEQALGLWRGRPYDEVADLEWARAEVARLEELRAAAVDRRFELRLDDGRHTEVIGPLQEAVAEEPFRERRRMQLALALYRSGRQAEALRAIQDFRAELADELGLDPSPELDALEHRILEHDPGLLPASHQQHRLRGYELDEVIGEGAFSRVWRGVQPALGRTVAVKQIRAELANQPEFIRRFETEAQTVAALEHPHIVPLYDYWREPDSAYLVMRYVAGGTLESEVLTHRLDDGRLRGMIEQVGAALQTAHRAGVIHRDVKSANVLLDGEGNFFLTDFGIAFTGAADDDEVAASLSTGSPAYASPEQLRRQELDQRTDVYGFGITIFEAATGRLPFVDAATHAALITRQLEDPVPAPSSVEPSVPAWVDEVVARSTAKHPGDRYPSMTELMAAVPTVLRAEADRGHALAGATAIGQLVNPFKALRAFRESDAADFHGRERLIARFVEVLARPGSDGRVLAAVGPSGSGKSSAVRSGLLPQLRRGAVPGSDHWFITTMLPGLRPFDELESALTRVAVRAPGPLVELMRDDPRGIARAVKQVLPDEDSELLVVIDQFEELFTHATDDERIRFLDGLLDAVREPRARLRVVVTIRADFWDRPLRHPGLAARLETAAVSVSPLAADELEAAIVQPVRRQGAAYEPGLVARIIADVGDQPGALPLLQYALTELFDRHVSGLIRAESYDAIGGLTGALASRAEATFEGLSPSDQLGARRLFGRLVTLGEGTEDTRRRVRVAELGGEPDTAAVVDAFGEARMLVFDVDPTTREPTVEIAHEALLRAWPRLRGWLDEDRDGIRIHRHLIDTTAAWLASDRDSGELYRGGRLETAETWAADHRAELNEAEREFLGASVAAHEAEQAAERKHLEDQVRSNRRLRVLASIAAVVALIAATAGAFALQQRSRADDNAAEAERQADAAGARAAEAEEARGEAVASADLAQERSDAAAAAREEADRSAADALQQAAVAEAAELVADIERLRAVALARAAEDPSLAALLAVEAHRLDPSIEGLDAIHRVLTEIPGYHGTIGAGPYLDGTLLADDTFVAISETSIDVWNVRDRSLQHSLPHPSPGSSTAVAKVDDDHVGVIGSERLTSVVYRLSTGDLVATLEHDAHVNDIAVSPDGSALAAALVGGSVDVWSLDGAPQRITRLATGDEDVFFVDWHPDGNRVAVVTLAAEAQLWDVGRAARLWSTEPATAGVTNQRTPFAVSFSPTGERFAFVAGSLGGGLRVLDTETGSDANAPVSVSGLTGFVIDDLAWTDDGRILIPTRRNLVAVDPASGSLSPVLDQYVLAARAVQYSPSIDRFVVAGLGGLEFWSDGDAGPLTTVVSLSGEQLATVAAGGGPILASLAADGSRLFVSVFSTLGLPPTTEVDLTTTPPTASVADGLGVTIGFGEYTLDAQAFQVVILGPDLEPLGEPVPLPFDFSELGVSEDGRLFAFGRLGGKADVYRTSGEFLGTVALGDESGFAGAQLAPWFTSDGEFMTLTTTDGRAGLWRTSTLERVDLADHDEGPTIALGSWLFASTGDGAMQRLLPSTLDPVGERIPLNGLGALGYAKYDRHNDRVAATGSEVAKVFDVETGRQLGRDLPYGGGSNRVEFTADGSILSVPVGAEIWLWNYDTDTWADLACELAGRNLTRTEWEEFGPRTIEYRATCPQYPTRE